MITEEILINARLLWDYHHMNHDLRKSDCILAGSTPGSGALSGRLGAGCYYVGRTWKPYAGYMDGT